MNERRQNSLLFSVYAYFDYRVAERSYYRKQFLKKWVIVTNPEQMLVILATNFTTRFMQLYLCVFVHSIRFLCRFLVLRFPVNF